jgi:uncharacterized phosphosugar-binding protein
MRYHFMESWINYIENINNLINRFKETQFNKIEKINALCAQAIASGGLVHLFGTGHSSLAILEMMPRTGAFVGFHPLIEPSLTNFSTVIGQMGHRQATYLERLEGFGQVILKNYAIKANDVMIIISHSGINPVVIDVALEMKKLGNAVIAITSVEHSSSCISRHSSGHTLIDLADIVLDTGIPYGDAVVTIQGISAKTGPASSVLALLIVNVLRCGIADNLVQMGHTPIIMPNPNVMSDQLEQNDLDLFYETYKNTIKDL